jgi:hypothetical protein
MGKRKPKKQRGWDKVGSERQVPKGLIQGVRIGMNVPEGQGGAVVKTHIQYDRTGGRDGHENGNRNED